MRRLAALLVLLALALAVTGADAHPLGNFSISHYTALEIGAAEVTVRYVIDMAEIPTFQETQDTGLVAEAGHASVAPWSAKKVAALVRGLRLTIGEQPLSLTAVSHETIFPPGAGGLPTLKLGVVYRAPLPLEGKGGTLPGFPHPKEADGTLELRYRDENFAERAGWKEIIARPGPGVTLVTSTAPATDRSRELSDYPTDLLNSPPQDVEARVSFTRGTSTVAAAPAAAAPPMALRPNVQTSGGNAFADLVAHSEPGLGLLALALATAAVLGGFHALEPGHGKTVVAAYLVGSRGTAWHALILGVVVTISHTAGVYLLGAVTFYASKHVVPEQLYPWLSLFSGLTIALLGAMMFIRRFGGVGDHHHGPGGHHHGPGGHTHSHDGLPAHTHGPGEAHNHASQPVSLRALVALGVSGGIIPCPAALVVLLTALSLHRVGFGLVLIVAFSIGLAAVLVAIGILMVYAGRLMTRFKEEGPLIQRWLPLTSSAVMTLLGFGIAVQAVVPWIRR